MKRRPGTTLLLLLLTLVQMVVYSKPQPWTSRSHLSANVLPMPRTARALEYVDIVAKRRAECEQCYKKGLRKKCLQMIEACEEWYFAPSSSVRTGLLDRAEKLHASIREAGTPEDTMICNGFKFLLIDPAQTCDVDIGDVWDLLSAGLALNLMSVLATDAHLHGLSCAGWDFDHGAKTSARNLAQVSLRGVLRPYATSITLHSLTSTRTSMLRRAVSKLRATSGWQSYFSTNIKLMKFQKTGKRTFLVYVPFRSTFANELPYR